MAKSIKIFCVTGLGVLMLCLAACEEKKEPMKPAPPKVVSKSIELPKKPPGPLPGKTAEVDSAPAKPISKLPDAKAQAVPQAAASSSKSKPTPELKSETVPESGKTADIAGNEKTYARKGRIDPFVPLLSEKKEPEPAAAPEKTKPKRVLTPLEKMELSQIKLVAVIEMPGRAIAMVEEASGKGYEVKIGTYMGRDGGRVSAITSDGIVIKEMVKDFKGNRRERFQEIKFNKNEGN